MTAIPANSAVGGPEQRSLVRRILLPGLTLIMVAGVAWFSGLAEWLLIHTASEPTAAEVTVPIPWQGPGQTVPIPPPPVGNDSSISPVPMPLILTGTLVGRNPREGAAFIGVDASSPQTYAAGAVLANNARIVEIHADRVVLERAGQRVNLYLHGSGKASDVKQLAGLLTVGGVTVPPPAKATSHEVLTDYIRPSPVYDGYILRGYEVYPGQNASVFSQMGLQAGDIITSINGVALSEPTSAIEQLRQVTNGYAVTANVLRQGATETLSLDGGLIGQDQQRKQYLASDVNVGLPQL